MLLRYNCTAFTQELNGIAFSRPMCWGCKAGAIRLKRGVEAREMVLKHEKRLLKISICLFVIFFIACKVTIIFVKKACSSIAK